MTPPVCMNSGGIWGGGTLLSSCSGQCSGGELCDVAVDGAYTCLNYTDSAFVLLIRDSGYVGDEDSASRVADPNYVSTVADLPDDTGLYPHIDNCYLYDVAKLEIPSDIDQFVLAGGDTYRAYYKGRVGYLNFNSNFIANQSQITRVSLISLNLKDIMQDLPSKLPANITQLDLKNTLTYRFPDQLTALTKLEELSLEGNYISTLGKIDVIPTLKSLNLASNNITAMPTSLSNHENLESLNLGSNKIKEVSSSDSSDTLTMLNLSDNSIVTFEATYPNLETLYLGNNNLTEIPDAVYDCTKLKHLYLSGKNPSLLSPIFTEDQFQFLQDLDTLDVAEDDFDTQVACQSNNTQQLRSTIQVCLTSTTTATTTEASSASTKAWKIIALAVGGGLVVLVLLVIAVCMCRRRRRAAKFITAELDDPQLAPLMLKPGDIKNIKKIGTGAHCVVWLVKYRKTQLLASKRLRKDLARRRITKAFIEEIKLVAPLDHPSVVKLVGIAWTVKTDIQALFEYVDNGNVNDYLSRPGTLHEWTQQKLQIALEVAEALVYLHSFAPPVLHRNLSASDVLLTSGMKAKVSKIGVSHLRVMASGDKDQQTAMGPWQAPEVLMGADDRDPAVDIFSFGVLLSELDTHAPPYNDARSLSGTQLADAVVLQMIAAGAIRLRFGEDCPPDLRSLADSCLAKNPRMRPAASEVVYALRTIKKLV
ncbi:hypothetical protein KRP22_011553 [Phytophthora ramorum]|nr:putative serine/threonine-protein kinase/receptor R826 [Phytophthora ramorum]